MSTSVVLPNKPVIIKAAKKRIRKPVGFVDILAALGEDIKRLRAAQAELDAARARFEFTDSPTKEGKNDEHAS